MQDSGLKITGASAGIPSTKPQVAFQAQPMNTAQLDSMIKNATNNVKNAQELDLSGVQSQIDDQVARLAVNPTLQQNQKIALDPLFKQLKSKLVAFMRQVKRTILEKGYEIQNFHYRRTLYMELRRLLGEVLMQPQYDMQRCYLEKIYVWFFERLRGEKTAIVAKIPPRANNKPQGSKPKQQQDPINFATIEQAMKTDRTISLAMEPNVNNNELSRDTAPSIASQMQSEASPTKLGDSSLELFQKGMRTAHTDIRPAKDRLQDMKSRFIAQQPEVKIPYQDQSTKVPQSTASHSSLRQPVSFFTSKQSVNFESSHRIQGKSSYMHYLPTKDPREQKLEQAWLQNKNKQIIQKRNHEQLAQTINQWGLAKARYQQQMSRKIQRAKDGSNFNTRAYKTSRDNTKNWMRAAAAAAAGQQIDYEKVYYEDSTSEDQDYDDDDDEEEEDGEQDEDGESANNEDDFNQDGGHDLRAAADQLGSNISSQKMLGKSSQFMKSMKVEPVAKVYDMTVDPVRLPPQEKKKDSKQDDLEPPSEQKITLDKGKQKIAFLRKFQGHSIKATNNKMEDLNNIFISSRATGEDVITLSVHTRGQKYRPKTSGGESTARQEDKDGQDKEDAKIKEPETQEQKASQSLQLMNIKGLNLGLRSANDDYRIQQMNEINTLKQRLARENVFCPIQTLQRAILMPQDAPPPALVERRFPALGINLLTNPLAEKKKKKKKKGKGKKKKKK